MGYQKTSSGLLVPQGAITAPAETYRADSWVNGASGMGIAGLDKTTATTYSSWGFSLHRTQLDNLYQHDWLSRKICTKLAEDATRKWIRIDGDSKALMARLDRLKLKQALRTASSWARLFGGAGIIMITRGDDPLEPLDPRKVKELVALEVFDRWWLSPVAYNEDITSPDYQKPEVYQTAGGQRFHTSRVLKFYGCELTRDRMMQELWWGGSVVESAWQAIKDFQGTTNDVRYIMTELNIGILQIPDLTARSVVGGTPLEKVQNRVSAFNATKSNYRVAAIDSKETFNFVNRSITGVPDVMDRFMTTVAAASDGMNELVLFGKSPSGLNASQEEQLQVWYDRVDSHREDQMAPAIQTILDVETRGKAPDWDFEAIYEMSDEKKATVMQNSAAAMASIAELAGLAPSAVIRQLNTLEAWDLPEDDEEAPSITGAEGEA